MPDHSDVKRLLDPQRDRLKRMVHVRMDRRLRTRLDSSDIVQEAMIEAARKLPGWQQNPVIPLYPWLRQIVWEKLMQLHRKHVLREKRSVTRESVITMQLPDESVAGLSFLAASQPSPSENAIREETQQRVRKAIELLPEADREVIIMRYLEQLSAVEIAACLGMSDGAIRMRHLRALERLRSLLVAESPTPDSAQGGRAT